MAIDIQQTDHLLDADFTDVKFTGPWTATAVAITAGQLLEVDQTSGNVQLVVDGTGGRFVGVATKDYDASATDVIAMYNFTAEVVSDAAGKGGQIVYGFDGGGVSVLSSEGPACGVQVGLRGAVTSGRTRVHFQLGLGPALS